MTIPSRTCPWFLFGVMKPPKVGPCGFLSPVGNLNGEKIYIYNIYKDGKMNIKRYGKMNENDVFQSRARFTAIVPNVSICTIDLAIFNFRIC